MLESVVESSRKAEKRREWESHVGQMVDDDDSGNDDDDDGW